MIKKAILGVLVAIIIAYAMLSYLIWRRTENRLPPGLRSTWSIASALNQYREEFGNYPDGKDNKSIADALFGKNPKQLTFLEKDPHYTNSRGELIDYWGTSYRFAFTNNAVEVRSAGEDRVFGTADDQVCPEPPKRTSP